MKFFLGTHRPNWLSQTTVPLFVSDRTLRPYKTLPTARGEWALDSGGFSELSQHGSWLHGPSPREYAHRVRRYRDNIGGLLWAAPQDWMCEPVITAKTGLSVVEHQRRTVANFLELQALAPDLPFIPVLQGWAYQDYLTCAQMYADGGVDLAEHPAVGVGSVCRRQATAQAAEIITAIRQAVPGIRLHGFGIKTTGLGDYGTQLVSADSMAWSLAARKQPRLPGCSGHKTCANCARFAFRWRQRVLASLAGHVTRTPPTTQPTGRVSRKLDTSATLVHAQRLALSAFRHHAARLERDTTIRRAHRAGLSVRTLARHTDLSPARIGQILTSSDNRPLLPQLRALRTHWGVDDDPATRAVADHIIANLTATDLLVTNQTAA